MSWISHGIRWILDTWVWVIVVGLIIGGGLNAGGAAKAAEWGSTFMLGAGIVISAMWESGPDFFTGINLVTGND